MSILIHIGLPKTGTTWLQTSVFNTISNTHFVGPNKTIIHLLSKNNEEPDIDQLKKDFFNTEKNIIYSDPELSGLISFEWNDGNNTGLIAKRLKNIFPEAKILILLRNQIDFLASGYAYYIRKGGTYKFSKYFQKIKNEESGFSLDYLKYNNIIEIYSEIYGKDNVKVFLYEELKNNIDGFLDNLSVSFALNIDKSIIDFSKKNQRLRKGLIGFIRFFNHFTKKEVKEKTYIFNFPFIYNKLNNKYEYYNYYSCFGSPIKPENLIKDENLKFLNQYFKESNNNLVKFIGKEILKKYNYPL